MYADTHIAVKVENVSKIYRIGTKENIQDSLTKAVIDVIKKPINNYRKYRSLYNFDEINKSVAGSSDIIWALKDVSFEVKHGEVLGIIGLNGAGKSTLLKIISRITPPTHGMIKIRGNVSSLLEVGTGFHPELTGRENIYLNGTILGMKKKEIDQKYDEIVDFSGVEKFLETPVKRYSSGMRVRLAFSVAAHLDPEILIIDEVLAVGDAGFQRKCLGKMENVAKSGRTVLFVSHNTLAIQSLCTSAVLLNAGTVSYHGTVSEALNKYLSALGNLCDKPLALRPDRSGAKNFKFSNVVFYERGNLTALNVLITGQSVVIRIHYISEDKSFLKDVGIGITFFTTDGVLLFDCWSKAVDKSLEIGPGNGFADCVIPRWPLKEGRYSYSLFAATPNGRLDAVENAGVVTVENGDFYGSGCLPSIGRPGVLIDYSWETEQIRWANIQKC